jgi:threonine/homoserine/homoserine lactone efflux protein
MGELLGNLIPIAIVMAISPIPIIAVILMLSSKGALVNTVLFDAGWLFAIIAANALFLLFFSSSSISGDKWTGSASYIIQIVLGALLLLLGVKRFVQRRKGVPEKEPKLLKSIETIRPGKAALFGIAMVILNPKNLVLLLAAFAQVMQTDASTGTNVAALAVFTLVGSLGVLLPLAVYGLAGDRATSTLASWNTWLADNNSAITMYMLLVLGVALLVKGIVGLA